MNKSCYWTIVYAGCWLALQACNSSQQSTPENQPDSTGTASVDTIAEQDVAQKDTIEKFVSEPGLFKMIRENYLNEMTADHSILVIPVVSGCSCGLVDFEELDSHLTAFESDKTIPVFWLLKGEDAAYSDKIAKYYPNSIELQKPKRSLQEYGLFQSSNLVFELRNNSEIVRWISVVP